MDYGQAKKIRGKSFGTLLAEQEGGAFSSLNKAISLKSQAKMEGLKETFDPMNIVKFMTGGSNWAPALLGKLTGRKQKSIDYFSGVKRKGQDTASRLSKIGDILAGQEETGVNKEFLTVLYDIESLLQIGRAHV